MFCCDGIVVAYESYVAYTFGKETNVDVGYIHNDTLVLCSRLFPWGRTAWSQLVVNIIPGSTKDLQRLALVDR